MAVIRTIHIDGLFAGDATFHQGSFRINNIVTNVAIYICPQKIIPTAIAVLILNNLIPGHCEHYRNLTRRAESPSAKSQMGKSVMTQLVHDYATYWRDHHFDTLCGHEGASVNANI
ncbi:MULTISPECIES: hypothetical protein [unclassified Ochrobactrum]|uniref:hypothetical protein n=1 Tax=unclassified Ochrobactrum TaxID=239106 RepID=UPI0030A5E64B